MWENSKGKEKADLPTCSFHPADYEMDTLQVPAEQFSLFYALWDKTFLASLFTKPSNSLCLQKCHLILLCCP